MSQEELVSAFAAGQLSRRDFIKKMAIVGGAVGMALTATQDALADDVETAAKKAGAKKAAPKKTAKKAAGKKAAAKKAT